MAVERTFSIIKPDAVAKNVIGEIYSRFEKNGLRIVASKMLQLSNEVAGGFYAEHAERPFYPDLITFTIHRKPMRELFGQILPNLSMQMQYTALTRRHLLRARYHISSLKVNFAAVNNGKECEYNGDKKHRGARAAKPARVAAGQAESFFCFYW